MSFKAFLHFPLSQKLTGLPDVDLTNDIGLDSGHIREELSNRSIVIFFAATILRKVKVT